MCIRDRFGSEGLTLIPSEGGFGLVLTSGEMPAASSPGRVITAGLLPDNTLEMYSDYLNGEAPVRETGVWSLDEAGQFTFELTANDAGEFAAPQTIGWAWAEGAQLVAVDSIALTAAFPGLEHERYWAASPRTDLEWAEAPERIAYTVDFDPDSADHGRAVTYFRSYSYFVRAVRDASTDAI